MDKEKLMDARNELSECIFTFEGQGIDAVSIALYERLNKILDLFDEAMADAA